MITARQRRNGRYTWRRCYSLVESARLQIVAATGQVVWYHVDAPEIRRTAAGYHAQQMSMKKRASALPTSSRTSCGFRRNRIQRSRHRPDTWYPNHRVRLSLIDIASTNARHSAPASAPHTRKSRADCCIMISSSGMAPYRRISYRPADLANGQLKRYVSLNAAFRGIDARAYCQKLPRKVLEP